MEKALKSRNESELKEQEIKHAVLNVFFKLKLIQKRSYVIIDRLTTQLQIIVLSKKVFVFSIKV